LAQKIVSQYMPGQVEREGLLQADQAGEVAFVAGLGQPVEGVVGALDVGGVVLAVVQLQDLAGDRGFECAVVVGHVGQHVLSGHVERVLAYREHGYIAMTRVKGPSGQAPVRRGAQGSVTRLPSGSLRVKVYAGLDPVTGRPRYIRETIADGPLAREQAEEACRRLLGQVRRRRSLHSHATVNDLLNRHLTMAHVGEHSRRSHLLMAAKHLRPFIGDLPLRAVMPEKLEHLVVLC
jgi:hypothetical protein